MMRALWRITLAAILIAGVLATPAAAQSATPAPTFTKDVQPILQRSCQHCHRPGSIAPMSLLTYEDVRPWARSIKQKIVARDMPPWFIDRTVGIRKFKDDPSLSDAEIATIVTWVDSGSLKGNPADAPAPRQFDDADKWHIGKPDLVVSLPYEHVVPPASSDWWGDYVADSGLTENRYIKAVETKPGQGALMVVHHAVTSLLQEFDQSELLIGQDLDSVNRDGSFLNEYAVGKNGDIFPDGSARLMKTGAKIRFNMHYHAIGEEIRDRTSVGLVFYPKGYVPKYHIVSAHTGDTDDLDIPPGASNVRHDGYTRLQKAARITSFQPHLHNRGKAQCMEAIHLDGRVEMLNCVDRYKFGWHIVYNYADDVAPLLPAGTILHVMSWHDNSTNNKYNPDPRNWVGFGQRSTDDMSFAWVSYVYLDDEDFKRQVEERKAKPASNDD